MTDPKPQTVVLDDHRTQALFVDATVEGGEPRVFYDLNTLITKHSLALIQNAFIAHAKGDNDLLLMLSGQKEMLSQLNDSMDALVASYVLSDVDTIADMFNEDK